ncbi:hypothetical protein L6R50_07200 [Myxococcota bacterium]|nr:hypothetical protein [Myxococcota bacterium]
MGSPVRVIVGCALLVALGAASSAAREPGGDEEAREAPATPWMGLIPDDLAAALIRGGAIAPPPLSAHLRREVEEGGVASVSRFRGGVFTITAVAALRVAPELAWGVAVDWEHIDEAVSQVAASERLSGSGGMQRFLQVLRVPLASDFAAVVDVRVRARLARSVGCRAWEMRWELAPDQGATLRDLARSGAAREVDADALARAEPMPHYRGGWMVVPSSGRTVVVYRMETPAAPGPFRWFQRQKAVHQVEGRLRALVDSGGQIEAHLRRPGHPPLPGPDGVAAAPLSPHPPH